MAELHPRRNNITTMVPPDIIFFHILPRLPAKSLLRFMCVCKPWHSFLTTPTFAKIHLHHVTNDHHQNHHKLLAFSTTTPCKFQTIDCEAPEDGLTASRSLPFEVSGERIRILASLNGLVCVGIKKSRYEDEYSDLILWNPLMGEYKVLSKPSSHRECYRIMQRALGFMSCEDDYRLLLITFNHINVFIYSLKSDSWRKFKSTHIEEDFQPIAYWQPGAMLNEKLYFLKQYFDDGVPTRSSSIMRFDLKTEKFTEIKTPFGDVLPICLSFTVLSGCIYFFIIVNLNLEAKYSTSSIELWRMDGDEDWTKVATYPLNQPWPAADQPLDLMSNGNWLMHSIDEDEGYVYKVDPEKPHPKDTRLCSYTRHSLPIHPQAKYIETFVSPNQYYTK